VALLLMVQKNRLYNQLKSVVLSQYLQGFTYITSKVLQDVLPINSMKLNKKQTMKRRNKSINIIELAPSNWYPTQFLFLPTPWSFFNSTYGMPPCLSLPSSRDPNRPMHLLPLGPGTTGRVISYNYQLQL